jgi:hypothetical protein
VDCPGAAGGSIDCADLVVSERNLLSEFGAGEGGVGHGEVGSNLSTILGMGFDLPLEIYVIEVSSNLKGSRRS